MIYIIVAILIIEYVVDQVISYANLKYELKTLPKLLNHKFSFLERKKMHLYHKANWKLGVYNQFLSLLIVLGLLLFGGFGYIDKTVYSITDSPITASLLFFSIIGAGAYILSIPWDAYNTFYIENRFGFNRATPKIFLLDQLKSILLSVIIGGGLLMLITWIYTNMREDFWWVAWSLVTLFSLFMMLFYSNLIVPLFNKQKPLEEGELRNKIETFTQKAGFQVNNIFVIDGSKRSTKANAYFTGLGSKKRIVLYDTLIKDLTADEIVAVLAHEIGHYKKNHTLQNLILGIAQTGAVLYLFHFIAGYSNIYEAIGAHKPSFHMAILIFGFLFSPVSTTLGLIINKLSRYFEYQADEFANNHGHGQMLISALLKLSKNNLSNLNPHPAKVIYSYSHPPLSARIKHIQNL